MIDPSRLPPVIVVAAPSRRSGKGTVAGVLEHYFGYTPFSMAFPLRAMFATLCMCQGIKAEELPEILSGSRKEELLPEVGLSFREFAEGVGTTWGRKMIDPELWGNMARLRLAKLLAAGKRVVIDDVRFENEVELAYELKGCAIYVTRPISNGGLPPTLASEGHLTNATFSAQFLNNGTVEDLESEVHHWMNRI